MQAAAAKRIMIVGGAGFLGQSIAHHVLAGGDEVAILDLFKPDDFAGNVDWIIGSALDHALFASSANNCDAIIFLASSSLPATANADIAAEIQSHVMMVIKAAEIAAAQGVSTFIFASSGGTVYGNAKSLPLTEDHPTKPITAYGCSKIAIENYLGVLSRTREMKTISLRISNPYGVGQRAHRNQGFVAAAMAAILADKPLPCWGDGSVVRDFIYIDDVAEAFALSLRYTGTLREFNIGCGEGRSLKDVITAVEQITGRPLKVEYQTDRVVDVSANILDVTLARHSIGWSPKTSFSVGLEKTARWWGLC